jgi:hypothetical protein
MAVDSAQDSDVLFPGSPSAPTGAAALAPKKPATVTPKPTPQPPAPSPTDTVGQAAQLPKIAENTGKQIQALELEKMKLNPPKIEQPPKPEMKQDPLSEWGRVALTLAAIGGHGSRQALTASLNAAASGMKGLREGNKEATDEAYKKWEVETRNAENLLRFQNDAYKTALANITNREEAARIIGTQKEAAIKAQIGAIATALQDPGMQLAVKNGGVEGAAEYQKKQQAQIDSFKDRTIRVAELKAENSNAGQAKEAYDEYLASPEGLHATEGEKINKRAEFMTQFGVSKGSALNKYPEMSPEQEYANGERIAELKQPLYKPQVTEHWPSAVRANEIAFKLNPNLASVDMDSVNKAVKDLSGGGKDGQRLQSLDMLMHHTQTLENLAKALPNTSDVQAVNRLVGAASAQFGHPEVTDFEFAKKIYVDELAKQMAGVSGGGVADRAEYAKNLSAKFTNAQMFGSEGVPGIFDIANELVGGRVKAMEDQYAWLPQSLKDRYFKPEVMEYFKSHGGTSEGGSKPVTPKSYGEARKLPVGTTIMLQGEPHKITGEEDWYKWKGQ